MTNTKNKVKRPTTARVARPNNKVRNLSLMIIAGLIVVIVAIWSFVLLSNDDSSEPENKTETSTQQVERTVSGKTADEDRKDALAVVTDLLNISAESPTGEPFNTRLEKLNSGDRGVINPKIEENIRFVDTFAESKDLQTNVYQSLVTFATLIQQTTGQDKIAPLSVDMWKNVHVDSELGTAFVPLAAYAPQSAGFSFEMVYVDGEWKLSPYSIIDSVKLSAKLQLGTKEAASSE